MLVGVVITLVVTGAVQIIVLVAINRYQNFKNNI
jgi:hypothetical protein